MLMGALVSCVYPFSPELPQEERKLVVEGDIILGDYTNVKLSYMAYLDERDYEPVHESTVMVQDSEGNEYQAFYSFTSGIYTIDTRQPKSLSAQYRLYVKLRDGREYASEWQTPRKGPEIDSITHELDDVGFSVRFNLSLHSNDGEQYFRWSFDEDWEYRVYYRADYYYVPPTPDDEEHPYGQILPYGQGEGTRYCWKKGSSTALMLTTTKELSSDTVTEKNFYRINRDNQKFMILYSMNLKAESLSEDAYNYWHNMSTNSENVGNLFAPIPSEMRGNIYSLSDPDELVLGFINVSTVSQQRIFVDNEKTKYYTVPWKLEDDEVSRVINPEDWRSEYYSKYKMRPIAKGEGDTYYWSQIQCVDCRYLGGTKDKPSFWPNDHY